MGNQKQRWTAEEEEALLAGVAKHGAGKWKNIIKDPDLAPFLIHRSNIDLKDKWRNLSVNISGHGSKEGPKAAKIRNCVAARNANVGAAQHANVGAAQHANVQAAQHANVQAAQHANVQMNQNSAPRSVRPNASPDAVVDSDFNSAPVSKNNPRYHAIIFEALSTMKDMNGSDIGAILNFIEQRHEVPLPPSFRKLLGTKLRKLVSQGKLEKVQNCYKIKKEALLGITTPNQMLQNSVSMSSAETVQDVADNAAYKLVDAENKYFLAAEAMREAERISTMAEDTEAMLLLMKEIYEQCSRGEVVVAVA